MDNLNIFKDKLKEIEGAYIPSNDDKYLISLAKELISTVEEQQEEIEQLKQYKKTLMEASIVRSEKIEKQQEEIEGLQNKLNHFMKDSETKQEIIYKAQRKLENAEKWNKNYEAKIDELMERTALIRHLGEKSCDRNDEALKKLTDKPKPNLSPNDWFDHK